MSETITTTEPRPRRLTPEMADRAARALAAELAREGLIEASEVDDRAADIAKHGRPHIDGYDLAKALDNYAHWGNVDARMVEVLDQFSYSASREIEAAEKAWAERVKPVAPIEIGTRVRIDTGEHGKITGIYEHGAAKFLVKIDGETGNGRRIVNFEDARRE